MMAAKVQTGNGLAKQESKETVLYGELQLPFKHSYIQGWIYPPFIKQANLDRTTSFALRSSDVLIATFPKNGTTWTQKIIQNLHNEHKTGHLTAAQGNLLEIMPWLENTADHGLIDDITGPRYIKTHNSYDFVAYNPNVACKYIYIARNPKDVCVSLWHHCRGFAVFNYAGEFAEFSQLFLEGKVESGDWWVHVKEFYNNARNMNVLFLKYEDMHADGPGCVKKINDFCSLPELSHDQAVSVSEASSFRKMKTDAKSNYSWLDDVRNKKEAPFMRKGTVGDWANYFSEEMSAKFDAKTQSMFQDIKLEFSDGCPK